MNTNTESSGIKFVTISERPDLLEQVINLREAGWPEYVKKGALTVKHAEDYVKYFSDFLFVLLQDRQERALAYGAAIPLAWDGSVKGLPQGWDAAYEQAFDDRIKNLKQTTLCALGVVISPLYKGKNLSCRVIEEMKRIGVRHGLKYMIAPVRPNLKKIYPLTPIENYIRWKRPDGAPFDPWIRVHWRMGAKILAIAPCSMLIGGKVTDWENWTGMIFPETGHYVVPDALQPIKIDTEKDFGTYEEPNVWMEHLLT